MKTRSYLFLSFFLIFSCWVTAQHSPSSTSDITAGEILHHIKYLASDELQGRKAGTEFADRAATYIAEEFRTYGLRPIGD